MQRKAILLYQGPVPLTQLKTLSLTSCSTINGFVSFTDRLFIIQEALQGRGSRISLHGMAKETAHQLGNAFISLIAWLEYLRSKGLDPGNSCGNWKMWRGWRPLRERFSKIGPVCRNWYWWSGKSIYPDSMNYMKLRDFKNVTFFLETNKRKKARNFAQLNVPLE